jgi:NADP-dependent 3-hydroxy acid dehydrogenase YdfG
LKSQDLNQRVALITGASAGIGRSTALMLARAGVHVYALGRNRAALNNLCSEAQTQGLDIRAVEADVADSAQIQLAVKAMHDAHGQVDILLNNAGVMYLSPMKEGELHDWTVMIQTNLIGTLNTMQAVLPGMVTQGRGDILNFSSISARLIGPGTAVYAASKKAVEVITESMRQELAGTGVRVGCIQLGGVATSLNDKIRNTSMRRLIKMRSQSYHDLPVSAVVDEILHILTRPRCLNIGSSFILSSDQAS